jgi:hypothetical protein
MPKWCSWIPGLHGVALNKCRREALSSIIGERLYVERMAQHQRPADEGFAAKLIEKVLNKLDKIYADAKGGARHNSFSPLFFESRKTEF